MKLDTFLAAGSLSLALSLPVLAQPPHDQPPPQVMRPDIQMHSQTDGRGDMHEAPVRQFEAPPAAVKPAPESLSHRDPQLPVKSEISMKARPGDDTENAASGSALKANPQSKPAVNDDRMGRREAPPPVQIKTQVLLKLQGDESPEASTSAAKLPDGKTGDAKKPAPHSRQELKDFQKHTGLSFPFDPEGSDSVDDKAE